MIPKHLFRFCAWLKFGLSFVWKVVGSKKWKNGQESNTLTREVWRFANALWLFCITHGSMGHLFEESLAAFVSWPLFCVASGHVCFFFSRNEATKQWHPPTRQAVSDVESLQFFAVTFAVTQRVIWLKVCHERIQTSWFQICGAHLFRQQLLRNYFFD